MMDQSEQINELAAALVLAQAEIEPAAKSAINPHLRSHYADLASVWEACRKPLTAHGLSVVQCPEPGHDDTVFLRTTLIHTSGQWVSSSLRLFHDKASMQSLGSAITYARRYALSAMVGIVADHDDDGEKAGVQPQARESLPSQARPENRPERDNGRSFPANGQRSGPPRSGKALFAWLREQEEKNDAGILKHVNAWAKRQGIQDRIVDFNEELVSRAYAEAVKRLQAVPAGDDHGDAYEGVAS